MKEAADLVRVDSAISETEAARAPSSPAESMVAAAGRHRWVICALLFFAATINYIDRQTIGILKTTLQTEIGWSEIEYSWIVVFFQMAYAIGLLAMGGLMDRLGTKKGFSLAVVFWSIAAMGHALARSVMGFGIARFMLGLGESGNFPASIKTVAEWFPKKERALATGLFNAGTNVGVVATPPIVSFITLRWGWQAAFVFTGSLGFIWLACWLIFYRRPEEDPRVSAAELAYIKSDPGESAARVPWSKLVS